MPDSLSVLLKSKTPVYAPAASPSSPLQKKKRQEIIPDILCWDWKEIKKLKSNMNDLKKNSVQT